MYAVALAVLDLMPLWLLITLRARLVLLTMCRCRCLRVVWSSRNTSMYRRTTLTSSSSAPSIDVVDLDHIFGHPSV